MYAQACIAGCCGGDRQHAGAGLAFWASSSRVPSPPPSPPPPSRHRRLVEGSSPPPEPRLPPWEGGRAASHWSACGISHRAQADVLLAAAVASATCSPPDEHTGPSGRTQKAVVCDAAGSAPWPQAPGAVMRACRLVSECGSFGIVTPCALSSFLAASCATLQETPPPHPPASACRRACVRG